MCGDLSRNVMNYVRTLQSTVAGSGSGTAGLSTSADPGSKIIQINEQGFPLAPTTENVTKKLLEKLYRSYLEIHYGTCLLMAGIYCTILINSSVTRHGPSKIDEMSRLSRLLRASDETIFIFEKSAPKF